LLIDSKETQMVRWEYLTIDLAYLPARTDEIDLLNEAGEQGWELIAIMSNHVAFLRRQVDNPADAPANPPTRRGRQGVG
jgi:hypothetical protein